MLIYCTNKKLMLIYIYMKKIHFKVNNTLLIVVLSLLGLLISGLLIAIFFINKPKEPIDNTEEETVKYDEDGDIIEEENYELEPKDLDAIEINQKYQDINKEAQALLNTEPVDIKKINELYDSGIAFAVSKGRNDYIVSFYNSRNDALVAKGLKQEALDALLTVDINSLGQPDQYRYYTKVIELAQELNDNATATKYQELRAPTEEAYRADYEATENAIKQYEENKLKWKEQAEREAQAAPTEEGDIDDR